MQASKALAYIDESGTHSYRSKMYIRMYIHVYNDQFVYIGYMIS